MTATDTWRGISGISYSYYCYYQCEDLQRCEIYILGCEHGGERGRKGARPPKKREGGSNYDLDCLHVRYAIKKPTLLAHLYGTYAFLKFLNVPQYPYRLPGAIYALFRAVQYVALARIMHV